jgi:hypothetical protein
MSSESIHPPDQSIPTNSCTYDAIELILKKASLLAENLDFELSTGNQSANKSSSFAADRTNESKEYLSDNINKKNQFGYRYSADLYCVDKNNRIGKAKLFFDEKIPNIEHSKLNIYVDNNTAESEKLKIFNTKIESYEKSFNNLSVEDLTSEYRIDTLTKDIISTSNIESFGISVIESKNKEANALNNNLDHAELDDQLIPKLDSKLEFEGLEDKIVSLEDSFKEMEPEPGYLISFLSLHYIFSYILLLVA